MAYRRYIFEYLEDEISNWIVRKITDRARKAGDFAQPLIVSINDLIGQRIIATGKYESTQFDAIDSILSGNDPVIGAIDLSGTFIDVGANIGLFSLKFASRFDKCIAIEPHPAAYATLQANINLSRLTNISSFCFAASDSADRDVILTIRTAGELGWSTIEKTSALSTYKVQVKTTTIDKIVSDHNFGRIGLVKIDVEGHEAGVLRGAENVLREYHPAVLYEALSRERGREPQTLLRECGYRRFFIFKRELTPRSLLFGLPIITKRVEDDDIPSGALVFAVP